MARPKKTEQIKLVVDQEACINCRFFLLDDPKDEAGYCRKGPKVFVSDDSGSGWTYSVNEPDEWCGSYERLTQ